MQAMTSEANSTKFIQLWVDEKIASEDEPLLTINAIELKKLELLDKEKEHEAQLKIKEMKLREEITIELKIKELKLTATFKHSLFFASQWCN